MNEKRCVIVIPVHSPVPNGFELISFKQCFNVLGSHKICVVAPDGLDLSAYRNIVGSFETKFIHPKWQSSLLNYNKLKTSRYFYSLFEDYEFMLTFELDAFVFKDELTYWCNKAYDFIGAPWFDGYTDPVSDQLIGVGNSGFSLRNIQVAQKILTEVFYKVPEEHFTRMKRMMAFFKYPYQKLRNLGNENYTIQRATSLYEDAFFCYVAPSVHKGFQIAPVEEAMRFSFEVKPEVLFAKNQNELPMGCHAWWRYNLGFWTPFIENFGYRLKGIKV